METSAYRRPRDGTAAAGEGRLTYAAGLRRSIGSSTKVSILAQDLENVCDKSFRGNDDDNDNHE